jgi:HK97 family phage prohead protease
MTMSIPLVKGFVQSFEVKDMDSKTGTFIQAFTRYNVLDSDKDRGRKGMFSKTWSENFGRIRHLFNHNSNQPLGETKKLWDDEEYAYGESIIGKHDLGMDFIKMVESNLIKEASYGYNVIKSNQLKDGSNELLEVKQWEWSSLSGWGANEFTPVISLQKGLNMNVAQEYLDRYHNMKSFVRNTTATDNTIKMVEADLKNIENFFNSLIRTEAAPALQPLLKEEEIDTDGILAIIELQKQLTA